MLEIKALTKVYRTKGGADVRALDGVSLTFADTGMVFLLGKSGSGKSTLLNLIGGLDKPDSGEIVVKGRGSKTFSTSDFDSYRNTFIGFIFQEYNILNEFTVEQNIALALELQGKPKDREKIAKILASVEMEAFAKRRPNTLSGGQKQRIAIARALVKDPEIIMADEPTGALDSNTGKQVFDTLKKLSAEKLVIVVSHDREFAEIYGDRIIELKDGKVISDVTKEKIAATSAGGNVSFLGENTISIKSGASLTQQELLSIQKFISSAREDVLISSSPQDISSFKKQARIDENGARETFARTDESAIPVRAYAKGECKFIRSRLPLRHAIKIGASSMKIKPFRLFFTILLTFISFVMFGLFSTLMLFDEQQTMAESLKTSADPVLSLGKKYYITENGYRNGKLEYTYTRADTARFKEEEVQDIWTNIDANAVVAFNYAAQHDTSALRMENVSCSSNYYSADLYGFAITHPQSVYRSAQIVWGGYPKTDGEAMISDFLFETMKISKIFVYDSEDKTQEVTVRNYEDLQNVKLYVSGRNSSQPLELRICGVYSAPQVPEKYAELKDQQNMSDLSYQWQQERASGFYNYLIVSDSFYTAHEKEFASSAVSFDLSEYFRNCDANLFSYEKGDVLLSEFWNGWVSTLPAGENYRQMTVYGTDGKEISSLSADGVAISARYYADLISGLFYADGTEDDAFWEMNNAWVASPEGGGMSMDHKLSAFRDGEVRVWNVETQQDDLLVFTEAERLQLYGEIKEFLEGYGISFPFTLQMKNTNGVVVQSQVQAEGFYFSVGGWDEGVYMGENVYAHCNFFENEQEWTYESVTKYDATGERYNTVFAEKTDANVTAFLQRVYLTQDDSSFYSVQNPIAGQLESYIYLVDTLSQVFLYVGIAFAVFSMLLLFNFISVSISNKKKEIGILRAVGARSADVFKIFFSETVIIAGICLLLSLVASFALCGIFNGMIGRELGIPLSLFVFGPLSVAIMVAIAVVTSVISTFLPVYSIAKKRPVESIRSL